MRNWQECNLAIHLKRSFPFFALDSRPANYYSCLFDNMFRKETRAWNINGMESKEEKAEARRVRRQLLQESYMAQPVPGTNYFFTGVIMNVGLALFSVYGISAGIGYIRDIALFANMDTGFYQGCPSILSLIHSTYLDQANVVNNKTLTSTLATLILLFIKSIYGIFMHFYVRTATRKKYWQGSAQICMMAKTAKMDRNRAIAEAVARGVDPSTVTAADVQAKESLTVKYYRKLLIGKPEIAANWCTLTLIPKYSSDAIFDGRGVDRCVQTMSSAVDKYIERLNECFMWAEELMGGSGSTPVYTEEVKIKCCFSADKWVYMQRNGIQVGNWAEKILSTQPTSFSQIESMLRDMARSFDEAESMAHETFSDTEWKEMLSSIYPSSCFKSIKVVPADSPPSP